MIVRKFALALLVVFTLLAAVALTGRAQVPRPTPAPPADPAATAETRRLLANLHKLLDQGIMFGHQDDLAYGLDNGQRWIAGTGRPGEPARSDVQRVTGSYPAVFGWELGHVELDSARSLDAVPFARIRQYIRQVYAQGGINTISWHLDNPHDGKSAWDTTRTVAYILPGGPDHAQYVRYLDRLADFLGTLKGAQGEAIPVIFRPFHEHTGSWFWWGEKNCTAAEYMQLYQFTINYLRTTRKLHNLLIAYSPAEAKTKAHYLERYPGDGYVDVLGFDAYYTGDGSAFQKQMATELPILAEVARAHHKLPALTETGFERLPAADWWTKTLLPTIAGYRLSYALVWRNGRPDHYYAPYPGQASAADFKQFSQKPNVLFENRIAPLKLYSKSL